MKVVMMALACLWVCGCAARSQVMTRGNFDAIKVGSSVADFEHKVGSPYRVRKLPNGCLDYEYIERIGLGEEVVEENHYFLRIKNGRVITKRINQELPSAYDFIYDDDPNDVDLQ